MLPSAADLKRPEALRGGRRTGAFPLKTLHWYLTRQVLAALITAVAVLTSVLLIGNVVKEVLVRLINGEATLVGVAQAFALLLP